MKLYADEDFDHRVVARLRALGHDVVTVMDAGRRGMSDEDQLAHATAEGGRSSPSTAPTTMRSTAAASRTQGS